MSIYVTGLVGDSGGPNGYDLLVLKLRDDGTSASFVSTTFVGAGDDVGWGIAVADGTVYVVGTTDVGRNTDALLAAYDTDLNHLWDLSWGGAEDDAAYDVAVNDWTIYVTGQENGQAFLNAYVYRWMAIPTVSQGGMVVMGLLVLIAGALVIRRARAAGLGT